MAPITREQANGNAVTINNGAAGLLTWDTSLGPSTLISRTTASAPTIITAGVYAVTVQVTPSSAMTAAGQYVVLFDLDLDGEDPEVAVTSPPASAAASAPTVTTSMTYYQAAGAVLRVRVSNFDGVQNLGFQLGQAVIQRLS